MAECNEDLFSFFQCFNPHCEIDFIDQSLTTNYLNSHSHNINSTISDHTVFDIKPEVEPFLILDPKPSQLSPTNPKPKPKRKAKNLGRWKKEESLLFIKSLLRFGTQWQKISSAVPSRTVTQIRSHAQKYFDLLRRGIKYSEDITEIDSNIRQYFSDFLREDINPSSNFYSVMRSAIFKDKPLVIASRSSSEKCKYFQIEKVYKQ